MRAILPAILTAAVLWPAAVAATETLEPPDTTRYLRWGPVRVRPGLRLSDLGYDDNIFFRNRDQDRVGDYFATLSPGVEGLVFFGSRAFLTFRQSFDYTFYSRYHTQNYFNNRTEARVTFPLRKIGFFAEGAFRRLRSRATGELDSRPVQRERRLGGGVVVPVGWRTELELGASRSVWTNSDVEFPEISELLDRTDSRSHLAARYRIGGRTRILFSTSRIRSDFDDPASDRDGRGWDTRVGLEVGEGGPLTGRLEVGAARFTPDSPTRPGYSSPVGELSLAYRAGNRWRLRFHGLREVRFAVYQRELYLLNRRYDLTAVRYLNRLVGLEAGGYRGRFSFPGETPAPGEVPRADRESEARIGLLLRVAATPLGQKVEYAFRLRRYRRDSTLDVLDQSRLLVGVSASFGF